MRCRSLALRREVFHSATLSYSHQSIYSSGPLSSEEVYSASSKASAAIAFDFAWLQQKGHRTRLKIWHATTLRFQGPDYYRTSSTDIKKPNNHHWCPKSQFGWTSRCQGRLWGVVPWTWGWEALMISPWGQLRWSPQKLSPSPLESTHALPSYQNRHFTHSYQTIYEPASPPSYYWSQAQTS